MRRNDREITDLTEMLDVLRQCDTIRLGLNDAPYPYVVPLSFGWERVGDTVLLYVHGAREGRRHELAAKDPHVCVEASRFLGYAQKGRSLTCAYESLIGTGLVEVLTGDDARHGMDLLVEHCGFGPEDWDPAPLAVTSVWRITLTALTGKRRVVA